MSISRTLSLVTAAGIAAGAAFAASDAEVNPAVKARQAHMQLYAHNIGVLGGMAQGNIEYNAEAAQAAANNLVALSSINQTSYWPPGTSVDDIEGTRALPAAWDDMEGIIAAHMAFIEAAAGMADVAGNGLEAVQGAIGPLGGACAACHRNYRQSDG